MCLPREKKECSLSLLWLLELFDKTENESPKGAPPTAGKRGNTNGRHRHQMAFHLVYQVQHMCHRALFSWRYEYVCAVLPRSFATTLHSRQ
jgi:hypothetical protein